MVLMLGMVSGLPLLLLPLQILWLNLVTDTFPALALALEPGEPDVMRRPPRDPQSPLLSRAFLLNIVLSAAVITASALAVYLWMLRASPLIPALLGQLFRVVRGQRRATA